MEIIQNNWWSLFLLLLLTILVICIEYSSNIKFISSYRKRWVKLKIYRFFNPKHTIRYPKVLGNSEKIACEIFMTLLTDPTTKLYYDIITAECYMTNLDRSIYIFLESRNMKIINTVYGYDTYIQMQTEIYLSDRFRKELTKRRKQFKDEAMKKVEHSLMNTLEKLRNQNGI